MKVIDLFMQHFDWTIPTRKRLKNWPVIWVWIRPPCPKIITDFRQCCRDCKSCWKQYLESEV